jgi:adenosylmethionine---8-amino-7-oxononanoate aminotransferase
MNENMTKIERIKRLDRDFVWHPFTQMKLWEEGDPLIIDSAEGIYLIDLDGNRYIDGVSSLWVNLFGHRVKEIDDAVRDQLDKVAHSTLLGLGNTPSAEFAELLIEAVPDSLTRVFYSDSGSTATEIALKIAFQFWQQTGKEKKSKFVTFINGYHGDTIGSVSLGGIDLFHQIYHPLLFDTIKALYPYCYRCSLGKELQTCGLACAENIEGIVRERADEIAAVVIEPLVQGAAGLVTAPHGFLRRVADVCRENDVLLVADEVATGFGRTGKMFAVEHEEVEPDIMALAKGISGGYLPLAATLASDRVFEGFLGEVEDKRTFFHGHTYTGNPLAAAAAKASLLYFKEHNIIADLQPKIEKLTEGLKVFKELEHVGDVRQCGMMVGIELVADKDTQAEYGYGEQVAARVCVACRPLGLIIRNLGDVIIIMPPLVISRSEIARMLQIVVEAIKEVTET